MSLFHIIYVVKEVKESWELMRLFLQNARETWEVLLSLYQRNALIKLYSSFTSGHEFRALEENA